jgi:hypothetical protein
MDPHIMCTAVLKLSVLILSLTWCPAGLERTAPPAYQAAGVHIHVSAEGLELSIRWSRSGDSRTQPKSKPVTR